MPASKLLSRLLAEPTPVAARAFLASKAVAKKDRIALAQLAALETAWVGCDQAIAANVADLVSELVSELYEPFWFYRMALFGSNKPRELFQRKSATRPLQRNKQGFWAAASGLKHHDWLPDAAACSTFDAVVHFVQAGSGTGVHVGGGRVLTCAHVVDARDDDALEEGDEPVARIGRTKLVMFPSGRTFLCACVAVQETADGHEDAALLELGEELALSGLIDRNQGHSRAIQDEPQDKHAPSGAVIRGNHSQSQPQGERAPLPAAALAAQGATAGASLFCVGNPSSIDLESLRSEASIEFEPPAWHASAGRCEGYLGAATAEMAAVQRARGRAPTRGELKAVADAAPAEEAQGVLMEHSCWTYWGHSGAPLFDERGLVAAIHCAWDDRTGMRQAQKLGVLQAVLRKAQQGGGGTKRAGGSPAKPQSSKRRRV